MNTFAFKDLQIWNRAVSYADVVIDQIDQLNSDRKHFRLIEQLEAAVTSIALNIAEGKGRQHKKEFVQFLYISRGSLYETVTLLNIFANRNWISQEKLKELESEGIEIANMLKGLINSIYKS